MNILLEIFTEIFEKKYPNSNLECQEDKDLFDDLFSDFKQDLAYGLNYVDYAKGILEVVHQEGGGEGGGEHVEVVFKYKDKYYRAEAQYYSYQGIETEDMEHTVKEVVPKKVEVTQYHPI